MNRLLFLLLVLALGGCGKSSTDETTASPGAAASGVAVKEDTASPGSTYEDAHAAAIAAISISEEKGHAWNSSDALLEQAIAAAADGDLNRAIQLADDAREQAELAAEQADFEAVAWRDRVLSD